MDEKINNALIELSLSLSEDTAAMISRNTRIILSVFFFLCFSVNINLSQGEDRITANQSLSVNQTIVSSGGTFELGFFSPGNSSRYYIGIWYKIVTPRTVVWVANRETPISDMSSAELKISEGNLVLLQSLVLVWSTNVNSKSSNSVVATLGDDGNLVLRDGSKPNSTEGFWRSFDNPTDTLLPGGNIAYDKRTKTKKILTSWKNSEDPAPGLFSLELDPDGSQYVMRRSRTIQYWTSGAWNGSIFSSVPEMGLNNNYNVSYVDTVNETYLTYSPYNHDPKIISKLVMEVSGQLTTTTWSENTTEWNLVWTRPSQQCEVQAYCGAFSTCNQYSSPFCFCLQGFVQNSANDWNVKDYSGGCVREINLSCGNDRVGKENFLANSQVILPDNSQSVMAGSAEQCKSACSNNCSCTAYSHDGDKCFVWNGDLMNLQQLLDNDDNGRTIYVRVSTSSVQSPSTKQPSFLSTKKGKGIVIGAVVGSVAVVMVLLAIGWFMKRGRQEIILGTTIAVEGSSFGHKDDLQVATKSFFNNMGGDINSSGIGVPFCSWESILAATENFSDVHKLGRGGFGPVYKGMFPEGQEIAVKRLSSCSVQGINEFQNEVVLIAKLQHRNLVRLLGYCMKENEKILLYEYMPNKSLDAFLFDRKLCMLLNWKKRFDIILGIARGVLYLHHDSRLRIIHRDLKTSNILLDEEMNPKISDFGLARIVEGKAIEGSTKKVMGTYGYMSPEYALDGLFSIKSDVFSFGVIVLEIIGGKRNTGFYQPTEDMNLLGYIWRLWSEKKVLDFVDPILLQSCEIYEVVKCINVALLCVEEDPRDHPTMSNVVIMLSGETEVLPVPNRPAFLMRNHILSTYLSASNKPDSISNELTLTAPQGR